MYTCYKIIYNVVSVNGNPKPMEADDVVQIRKELRSIRKQVDYMLDRLDSGFASSATGVSQASIEGKCLAKLIILFTFLKAAKDTIPCAKFVAIC